MTNLSDRTVALLRTVVPTAWGTLVAWLLSRVPLSPEVAEFLSGLSELGTIGVIGAWYLLVRWLEPHLPDLLRTLLIGAPVEPTYKGPKHRA